MEEIQHHCHSFQECSYTTRITPRARRTIIQEVTKNPRVASKDLQASLALTVSVHEFTIRKTLNKNGVHGRIARRKPLRSKNNIAAHLKFVKDHLDDLEGYLLEECSVDR